MTAVAFVSLADTNQERLWRLALATQQIDVRSVSPSPALLSKVTEAAAAAHGIVILLDIAAAGRTGRALDDFVRQLLAAAPTARIIAVQTGATKVSPLVNAWATSCGAHQVIGDMVFDNAGQLLNLCVAQFPNWASVATVSDERFRAFLRSLNKDLIKARVTDQVINAGRLITARNLTTDQLHTELRRAVPSKDRRYRLKNYRICFVASDAVTWLAERLGVTRQQAVSVGRLLQAERRLYHVLHEHDFADDYLFFRYSGDPALLDGVNLKQIMHRLRAPGGLDIETREWHGKRYPQCFPGHHFVERLGALFPLGVEECAAIGQWLIDLGITHHVADEHPFIDGEFFYRFYADESPL